MTYKELIKKFAEWLLRSLKERWTKETDLDKSIKHTMRSVQYGDAGLDIKKERQYLMSRHRKDFWGLACDELSASETAPGRLHNFAKRLRLSQIAKDFVLVLSGIAALLGAIVEWGQRFG